MLRTSLEPTAYPPTDEKFLVGMTLYYLRFIYTLTLVVVNLPVKVDDDVASDDLFKLMLTLLPTTATVASIKSLSEVIELVTVLCAVVPAAEHMLVTSSICTLPSLLSIVTRVFAPLYAVLSN